MYTAAQSISFTRKISAWLLVGNLSVVIIVQSAYPQSPDTSSNPTQGISNKSTPSDLTSDQSRTADRRASIDRSFQCNAPEYPPAAKPYRASGTSTIGFLVNADASIAESKILSSSGFGLLDTTAQETLSQCKFKAAIVNGKYEKTWVSINIKWEQPIVDEGSPVSNPTSNPSKVGRVNAIINSSRNCYAPHYKRSSIKDGTTIMSLLVGLDGLVVDGKIIGSSGDEALDNIALKAISACLFKPATLNEIPIADWSQLNFMWANSRVKFENSRECNLPQYPKDALRLGQSGTTTLRLEIAFGGEVSNSEVTKSSGFQKLDEAARIAFSLCRFIPLKIDGVVQASAIDIDYKWQLPIAK